MIAAMIVGVEFSHKNRGKFGMKQPKISRKKPGIGILSLMPGFMQGVTPA